MRRLVSLLFLACFASAPCGASVNINTDVVKKSVVYIYGGDNEGKQADSTKILGTGFLVAVPEPSTHACPSDQLFVHLRGCQSC